MDLSKLTAGVISLTKEVGEFIRAESLVFDRGQVEYKGLHDMVSYVDKTAEVELVKGLKLLLPEAGFVTEEKTATITGEKYDWIIDLAYVACGRFDGYFEFNLNSYDVAAGIVLVKEAGGQIFDFTGGNKSIERREMLATNGLISTELLLILEDKFN